MKFGLTEKTLKLISGVFSSFSKIDEVVIYGSRAKGTFKKGSDIDLVLKGQGLDLKTVNSIRLKLDDLPLPYTFDISVLEQIDNPDLLDHIQRVGQSFYKKSGPH